MIGGRLVTSRHHPEACDRDRQIVRRRPRVVGALPHIAYRRSAASTIRHAGEAFRSPLKQWPGINVSGVAQTLKADVCRIPAAHRLRAFPDVEITDEDVGRASTGTLQKVDRLCCLAIIDSSLVRAG